MANNILHGYLTKTDGNGNKQKLYLKSSPSDIVLTDSTDTENTTPVTNPIIPSNITNLAQLLNVIGDFSMKNTSDMIIIDGEDAAGKNLTDEQKKSHLPSAKWVSDIQEKVDGIINDDAAVGSKTETYSVYMILKKLSETKQATLTDVTNMISNYDWSEGITGDDTKKMASAASAKYLYANFLRSIDIIPDNNNICNQKVIGYTGNGTEESHEFFTNNIVKLWSGAITITIPTSVGSDSTGYVSFTVPKYLHTGNDKSGLFSLMISGYDSSNKKSIDVLITFNGYFGINGGYGFSSYFMNNAHILETAESTFGVDINSSDGINFKLYLRNLHGGQYLSERLVVITRISALITNPNQLSI